MNIKKSVFLLLTAIVLYTGCTFDIGAIPPVTYSGSSFRAQKMTDNSWYDCPASLLASGTHCLVFVEDGAGVTAVTAQLIATEFDNNIYTSMRTNFGNEADVDSNGRIILLLLDIQDGYSGSGGYVAGYFDSTHEYAKSTYSNSNEADMLFMDIYPATVGAADFYGTIAHEFQHLINWSNTVGLNPSTSPMDVWINEGLSSGAEYLYAGAQVQSKIDYFNADPEGTISQGNNFFVWNGYWEDSANGGDVVADYATVYLFFQWLQIHAINTTGIYKDILASDHRDYQAVTDAAASSIDSQFTSWETLLTTWTLANLYNKTTGFMGYKSEINTSVVMYSSQNNAAYDFAPGEGIFSSMPTSGSNIPPAGSGTHIKYLGLSAGVIDDTAPYSGDTSLVINISSDNTFNAYENGYVANIAPGARSASVVRSVASVTAMPKYYPIDVQLAPGGGLTPDSHSMPTGKPNVIRAKR